MDNQPASQSRATGLTLPTIQSGSRLTIGFIGCVLTDKYAYSIWQGVMDAARERGVNLLSFFPRELNTTNGFDAQANVLYDLVSPDLLDGLVIWAGPLVSYTTPEGAKLVLNRYRAKPIVAIEGSWLEDIPRLEIDSYQSMRAAVLHLVKDHGYRRIAFIRGPDVTHEGARARYQAYLDVLAECDLPFDPNLVSPPTAGWGPEVGQAAITLLLDERRVDVEAVVGANDSFALGAMQALQARGIHIPGQVAVIGFDDQTGSDSVIPPLTTVSLQGYDEGRQAIEMLLTLLAGGQVPERTKLLPQLIIRQSCGCANPTVAQAATGPLTVTGKARKTVSASQRERIVAEMRQAVGAVIEGVDSNWTEQLLTAFLTELKAETAGVFLSTLDGILQRVIAAGGQVTTWANVISALRRSALPYLDHNLALRRAESLWLQAQVMVGEIAQQAQRFQTAQAEQRAQILDEIRVAITTIFDVEGLMDTLAQELPRLSIPGCYLSLYENPQRPTATSRLILAYDEQRGRLELPTAKQLFPSCRLTPEGMLPQDRTYGMVVEPLYFREQQLGFVLFESGPRYGPIYDALRAGISSALQGALLVEQEEKRAHQLQTVAEVGTTMSTILNLTELLQNVVDLTKASFNLYHAHIYLVNETGDTLQLAAGAGEVGRQMVAEGWQIALKAEKSLVAQAARARCGDTVNDTQADPSWLPNPLLPATRSELAVPLIAGDLLLGVLDVQADHVNAFNQDDIQVLTTLAGQIAAALQNARLYQELEKQTLEAEKAKDAAEVAKNEAEKAKKVVEVEKEAAEAAQEMAERARKEAEAANRNLATQMWQTTGQTLLNEKMRGEQEIATLAANIVKQLGEYLNVQAGMLYVMEDNMLKLAGTYAYRRKNLVNEFKLGEGRVGEAAVTQRVMSICIPDDYIAISLSQGEILPKHILTAPFVYEEQTIGVVEIESLTEFTPTQIEFLNKVLEGIAVVFTTARARRRVNELLAQTQQQAEELQAQEEELRASNEELEAQTESLRESQRKLQANQAELETANVELEEKAHALQEQRAAVDRQNQDLKLAQQELERKAEELALASKYKSEFLANMSHELRTPLNSLLILAGMLAKNEGGNLTTDQVESAEIIQSGGRDLLNLINDILDLSKVEAGKMEFRFAPMPLERLTAVMRAQLAHVAESKGVAFTISLAEDAPEVIETDQQRVEQIIKNLLSNAFKFTAQGEVSLAIYRPGADTNLNKSGLKPAEVIAISVRDTGIGMTPDQQKIVFEAFQQADGSTSRQYGGTGLGLAISRELAIKMGGQIELTSEPGQGSTFTLYLPIGQPADLPASPAPRATSSKVHQTPKAAPASKMFTTPVETAPLPPLLHDDRDNLQPDDHVLLMIEDDSKFAKVVYDYAHKKGFKCLLAGDGESGLRLVKSHRVNAIILDLNLPGLSGWEVLDTLKNDADTRHIPVHIMSVADQDLDAYKRGAIGFLSKPVSQEDLDDSFQKIEQFISRKIKSLLLVEDDANLRKSVRKLLEGNDIAISEADRGQVALEQLASQQFDCMILDLSLPDMSGFELLSRLDSDEKLTKCPVIVYTGQALSEEENHELLQYADSVIVKGVKSPERLLDETALFLHRVVADLPEDKQRTIKQLHDKEAVLAGKVILIVDDDARNAFALNKLLADKGLKMHIAINGQKALEFLDKTMVDLVLMDIMMPGMDGYEVMKQIRSQPRFRRLPILALTAKAMKGDREKCIAAGASDYLAKPIDTDRLFSMLRVWLSRE